MIEVPRFNIETYHCPNCAAPLESSYCHFCGGTITAFPIIEKASWPEGRDKMIDLTLIALFDKAAADRHLQTLNVLSDDTLVLKAAKTGSNFRDVLVSHSFRSSMPNPGENRLTFTLNYYGNMSWKTKYYVSFSGQIGRRSRVYYVRYCFDRGLDHLPETLQGEIALANSHRLTNAVNSAFMD